jgi:electron transfer flavoprotein alpha subunit
MVQFRKHPSHFCRRHIYIYHRVTKKYLFNHIIAAATSFGSDFMPRVSALLDVVQLSEVTDIQSHDTYLRKIYSGRVLAKIKSLDPIKTITICPDSFTEEVEGKNIAMIKHVTGLIKTNYHKNIKAKNSTNRDLSDAKIVIGVGRGIGNQENLLAIKKIAKKMDAVIGASRSAIEHGYLPDNLQIGQTGVKIAPDLYLSIGISGAIQHLAGIRKANTIIAIDIDNQAPIFQHADYGLVADINDVIPALNNAFGITN